jgi:hypothetical protein
VAMFEFVEWTRIGTCGTLDLRNCERITARKSAMTC